jgi:sugar/nucleoside kinase (ribokinase family)
MKVAIISNVVEDEIIDLDGEITVSVGGPPFYCGLIARKYGIDVSLITKFGKDLDIQYINLLKKNKIYFDSTIQSDLPTTSFVLKNTGLTRELSLKSKCGQITLEDVKDVDSDSLIISPVLDEIPLLVFEFLLKNKTCNFLMFDPQGYTRFIQHDRHVTIRKELDLCMMNVDGIKTDTDELYCITGGLTGIEGMRKLNSRYKIRYVILTTEKYVHLIDNNKHYWLNMPTIETRDSTGVGDILSAVFTSVLLKERDAIWAFCFAVGAVIFALNTKQTGIEKIPSKSNIEHVAGYIYNLLKFETL